jgi:hypothetical protein
MRSRYNIENSIVISRLMVSRARWRDWTSGSPATAAHRASGMTWISPRRSTIQEKSAAAQVTSRALAGGRVEVKLRQTGLQKGLVSLAPKSGPDILPVRWLENEDSYAWFARRIW